MQASVNAIFDRPRPSRRAFSPPRAGAMLSLALFCGAAIAMIFGAGPAAAAGWSRYLVQDPGATLARLNELRASYGAAAVAQVRRWSIGCASHMQYMQENDVITHSEQPGTPGYSHAGALAGSTSVLEVPGSDPFPADQPLGIWALAPYHQSQVLEPLLRLTGFSAGCLNTLRGVRFLASSSAQTSHRPPHLVVWPGQGASDVPSSVDACNELPRNPFGAVGWRCNQGTAFYAYTLDPRHPTCAAGVHGVRAALRDGGTPIPTRVTAGAARCSWIILTGRPLPRGAALQLTVSAGGNVVRRTFSAS